MLHRMPAALSLRLLLYLLFFASGAAGLIFELLWFRLAGLSFGNTIWASTAVLSAFMGGLALGNALAAWRRLGFRQPLRWYAGIEIAIAITGVGFLWLLPRSGEFLAQYAHFPALRLLLAFGLMLIPTTAMGLTLPLVVRALTTQAQYGSLLGWLYGVNTLGAVIGVLAAEYLLLAKLGVIGTGLLAGSLNLGAAAVALALSTRWPAASERRSHSSYPFTTGGRWLLAAALSGAVLLALEVVWFRLLLLHVRGTASAFAAMLAMVLVGIALGGLLASLWLRYRQASNQQVAMVAALAALASSLGYRLLPSDPGLSVWLGSAILMLGTAIVSGGLFTLLCAAFAQQLPEPSRATGRMLIANTGGGMLGAAIAGLWLLPIAGMHMGLIILMLGYLLCAAIILTRPRPAWLLLAPVALLLFPWQGMQGHQRAAVAPWQQFDGSRVIYEKEGLNETVQLLQRELFGEPLAHRVVTNGDSMSGTERDSRRYMKLFAWLPMALHPGIEDALLISYGLGSTAEALVADPQIKQITVVDISPEILEASRLTHVEGSEPLDDARVTVHIEDGRHYLLTSEQQFDLITGEPPPPRLAGIVNLYTREYFQLMHERLKPGGIASYWLPVDQLSLQSSQAILAAFCAVFGDCSLWSGSNYNWVLLGSRGGLEPVSEPQLTRLWQTPAIRNDISALGFERPAQLGATFIADSKQLKHWINGTAPLTDNWPKRLAEQEPDTAAMQTYARWLDNRSNARRFGKSDFIEALWPPSLRADAQALYEIQPVLNNELRPQPAQRLRLLDGLLEYSELKIPVFWLLESGIREQRIVDRRLKETGYRPEYAWQLAVRALADRRFAVAGQLFSESHSHGHDAGRDLAILSFCRANQPETAKALAESSTQAAPMHCW